MQEQLADYPESGDPDPPPGGVLIFQFLRPNLRSSTVRICLRTLTINAEIYRFQMYII